MVVSLPNVPPPRVGRVQFESRHATAPWWLPARFKAGWVQWREMGAPFDMWIQERGNARPKQRLIIPFKSKQDMRAMRWRMIEANPWQ